LDAGFMVGGRYLSDRALGEGLALVALAPLAVVVYNLVEEASGHTHRHKHTERHTDRHTDRHTRTRRWPSYSPRRRGEQTNACTKTRTRARTHTRARARACMHAHIDVVSSPVEEAERASLCAPTGAHSHMRAHTRDVP
jgi:hypothetical protein